MLVLTRGLGERFVIGDDIVITVVRVHGDSVSLGFRCPDALSVDMKDVHHGCLKPQRPRCRTEPRRQEHAYVDLG